jgi:hypothetical protein
MVKAKTKKRGTVAKVVRSMHTQKEQVEIVVSEGEPLYQEIRIENKFKTPDGKKVKLKEGANVDVVVEAEEADTEESQKNGFWSRFRRKRK